MSALPEDPPLATPLPAPRSAPPAPPDRPMPLWAAFGWSCATTFLFVTLAGSVTAAVHAPKGKLALTFACQAAAYAIGVLFVRHFHARDVPLAKLLGLERSRLALLPIVLALGAVAQIPSDAIYGLILRHFPSDRGDTITAFFRESSFGWRAALMLVVVVLGPLIEEAFFRGALLGAIRRTPASAPRRAPAWAAVAVTAAVFALAHLEWQIFLPIFLLGLILGHLRLRTGSLLPSTLMHGSFNAFPFVIVATTQEAPAGEESLPPAWLVAAGSAVTLALLALAHVVSGRARGEAAS